MRGGIAGISVAAAIVGICASGLVVLEANAVLGFLEVLGIPALVAAALGGFVQGPRAARAFPGRSLGTILALAVITTVIGACLVALVLSAGSGLGWGGSSTASGEPLREIGGTLLTALYLWPIGLLYFGLVALPITLLGAWAWALVLQGWWAAAAHRAPVAT